jgi:hypothetical protein
MNQLANGDLTLIGPGSEWFWSAFSGLVVAVSLLALWRQLRLQTSQKVREDTDMVDRTWESERMMRHRRTTLLAIRDGLPPQQWSYGAVAAVVNFWEGVASLARGGHIDVKALAESTGPEALSQWAQLFPYIEFHRIERNTKEIAEDFEWLVQKMAHLTGESVVAYHALQDSPAQLDFHIEALDYLLGIEESLRS